MGTFFNRLMMQDKKESVRRKSLGLSKKAGVSLLYYHPLIVPPIVALPAVVPSVVASPTVVPPNIREMRYSMIFEISASKEQTLFLEQV